MTDWVLPIVAAGDLPADIRDALRPGDTLVDRAGRRRALPQQFIRIDSWDSALQTQLTPHFQLWELISVDVRETPACRSFPRYVPCAILRLAGALELLRMEVGTYVHVAANGGYRSPAHGLSRHASRHCWGTAANIYRIGDIYLDSKQEIERFGALARRVIPGAWTRPYGDGVGEANDHLHIDLGYIVVEATEEDGAT